MKKLGKRLAIGLAALIVIVVIGFTVASLKASARLGQSFEAHRISIPVPFPLSAGELAAVESESGQAVDPSRVAMERAVERGKHLVEARYGCNVCHGANFAGGVMIDDAAIGKVLGPNITKGAGGKTARYAVADWDRIVRHGIKPDGSPAVMPSEDFFKMTDRELSDVVAYLQSRPAVDAEVAAPSFGPVGKVLVATGKFPLSAEVVTDHMRDHVDAPPVARDDVAFGAHMAGICSGCHRASFAGGPMPFGPPDWPPAANLTQHAGGLAGWSYEDFERALTEGTSKDGRKLRPPMTLLQATAKAMTSVERHALWTYLRSLPPLPTSP